MTRINRSDVPCFVSFFLCSFSSVLLSPLCFISECMLACYMCIGQVSSFVKSVSVRSSGLMGAALSASLEEDLSDYYRLIAVLETQLQSSHAGGGGGGDGSGGLTLRRLAVWAQVMGGWDYICIDALEEK